MADRIVRIIVSGKDAGATQVLQVVGASAERTASKLDRLEASGRKISALGSAMTSMSVPFLALGGYAVKSSAQFQQSMETLRTQAGLTQGQVNRMSGAVLNLSKVTGVGPNSLAQGAYHVASSLNATVAPTRRLSEELAVLKTAALGAQVGHANLVDVTNALDGVVVAGMRGVKNYSQAMGVLNATVGAGDMTMQDLSEALPNVTAGMKIYGVSIKDVGAALAVMGDINIRGAEAGTKLASAIRLMAAPSKAAAKYFNTIGLGTTQLRQDMNGPGGLVQAFKDLKQHLAPYSKPEQGLLITRMFGGRQSTAVQLLLAQLDRLEAKRDVLTKGMTGFGSAVKATEKNPMFQWQKFTATMQTDMIRLGHSLMPLVMQILPKFASTLSSILGWFTKLPKPVKQFLMFFTMFLAIGGPILLFTGKLVTSVASIAKGVMVAGRWLGIFGADTEAASLAVGRANLGGMLTKLGIAAGAAAAALIAIHGAKRLYHDIARGNVGNSIKHGAEVGGGGGFLAGALTGLLGGSETGPGALVTGLIGGLAGAFGGGSAGGLLSLFHGFGLFGPSGPTRAQYRAAHSAHAILGAAGPVLPRSREPLIRRSGSPVAAVSNTVTPASNPAGSGVGPTGPIELHNHVHIGNRITTEEVVHVAARTAALAGRLAVNAA